MSQVKEIDVIFYALTGLSSLQIGITGEVIKEIISKNKNYRVIRCNNALLNCYFNQFHNVLACASCQTRISFIHKKIGVDENKIINLYRTKPKIDFPHFTNYTEIINFNYKGINIGRGVVSSLISYYRDFNISSSTHKENIEFELTKAAIVVDNFIDILNQYYPKEFYIFNGRFSEIHPLIEICKQRNINFTTVESGSKFKYEFHKNCLPHNIPNRTLKMQKLWDKTPKELREKIGNDWYIKKRNGDETYAKSFKQSGKDNEQIKSILDDNKKNILILNSSEDEVKVIKEWEHDLYDSQNQAIKTIVKNYKGNNNYNFILRVHPNLKNVSNEQTESIKKFDFSNLKIIHSNQEVDTYRLIDEVDFIIVFGSSTGIEATYWGKPVLLFGRSFYDLLEVCYKPKSYEQLYRLIETDNLKPFPKENCLKYSFYLATRGNTLKWFEPKGKSKSKFMGHKIPVINSKTIFLFFKYFNSIKIWKNAIKATYNRRLIFKDLFRYKI